MKEILDILRENNRPISADEILKQLNKIIWELVRDGTLDVNSDFLITIR